MNIGDKIPEILGPDQDGKILKASDFAGKPLIIYFYPKDNTPGCTAEACDIRDNYERFLAMGYTVVGVSKDSGQSHRKFIEKQQLPFPLISDEDHKLADAFGVWQLKKMAGREYMGMVRTTFIISPEGVVTDVIRKVKTKEAASQIFELIDGRNSINPA